MLENRSRAACPRRARSREEDPGKAPSPGYRPKLRLRLFDTALYLAEPRQQPNARSVVIYALLDTARDLAPRSAGFTCSTSTRTPRFSRLRLGVIPAPELHGQICEYVGCGGRA